MIKKIKHIKNPLEGLKTFIILWATQAFSGLGSSMTSFALIIWSYQQQGSALSTALLSVCSYAPYVILSIFAGALSDRWNKKYTMLICDTLAALSTLAVLFLLKTGNLEIWHLYLLNALNGTMNTVQQPASDVSVSLLCTKEQYQKVSGLRAFSNSLVTVLTPVLASMVLAFAGINAVICFDLFSFVIAFTALAFFIHIPRVTKEKGDIAESYMDSVKSGLKYLVKNRGILDLILFLAAINLVASVYDAALPAMILSKKGAGETALGFVNACAGLANIIGSIMVSVCRPPKNRIRVIYGSLFFSMGTENFLLALGRSTPVWCLGAVLGWLMIPIMSSNMDVLFRLHIPVEMQGRVYSARNSLQFFTIPVGYLLGGVLVDKVFEPFMAAQSSKSVFAQLFGSGKGSGASMLFLVLAFAGIAVCLVFLGDKNIWELSKDTE